MSCRLSKRDPTGDKRELPSIGFLSGGTRTYKNLCSIFCVHSGGSHVENAHLIVCCALLGDGLDHADP